MSNMSYCRFNNTLNDLHDCQDALGSGDSLSAEERAKAVRLINVCRNIASEYEGESDEDILKSFNKEEDEEDECCECGKSEDECECED